MSLERRRRRWSKLLKLLADAPGPRTADILEEVERFYLNTYRGDDQEIQQELRGEIRKSAGPHLVPILVRPPDDAALEAAANVVSRLCLEQLGDLLLPHLDHPDPELVCVIIISLGALASEGAIDGLSEALEGSQHALIRREAAVALGEIGTPGAASSLRAAAAADSSPGVRSLAVAALGLLEGQGEFLESRLEQEEDDLVLASLYDTLTTLPDRFDEALNAASHHVIHGEEWPVRRAAGEYLIRHQQWNEVEGPLRGDDEPQVRLSLVIALGRTEGASELLLEALRDDTYEGVRRAALEALGSRSGEDVVDATVVALERDESVAIRFLAAHQLERRDSSRGREGLLGSLARDESLGVRERAARSLVAFASGEARAAVLARLARTLRTDEDEDVRLACVEALARVVDSKSAEVQDLIGWGLKDISPVVQARTLKHLQMGEQTTRWTNSLRKIVKADGDLEVRISAVEALARIGGASVEKFLKKRLTTEEQRRLALALEDGLDQIRRP